MHRPGLVVPIQYLRAAAALSVLFYHAAHYVEGARGGGLLNVVGGNALGLFGVTLFFVISGYLMARLAADVEPWTFLMHRIIRIYPVYWAIAGAVLLARLAPGQGGTGDPWAFALIPGDGRIYPLGVEWTLPFEIVFYVAVAFCIMIGLGRRMPAVAVCWLLLLILSRHFLPETTLRNSASLLPPLSHLLLSDRVAGFVLGLLIPTLLKRVEAGPGFWVAGTGLCLCIFVRPDLEHWIMALGCAALVAAAASTRPDPSASAPGVLLRLGDWSFTLYLVHVPIILWTLRALPATATPVQCWLAVMGAALATAVLVGRLDVLAYRRLKRACDALPRPAVVGLGAAFLLAFLGAAAISEASERHHWSERQRITELGRRAAELRRDAPDWATALRGLGLQESSELSGHLDQFMSPTPGLVRYGGWALDRSRRDEAAVILFADGAFLDGAVPRNRRPDVLTALRVSGSSYLGFSGDVATQSCRPGMQLEGLIVAGRGFAPLPIPPIAVHCPQGQGGAELRPP